MSRSEDFFSISSQHLVSLTGFYSPKDEIGDGDLRTRYTETGSTTGDTVLLGLDPPLPRLHDWDWIHHCLYCMAGTGSTTACTV